MIQTKLNMLTTGSRLSDIKTSIDTTITNISEVLNNRDKYPDQDFETLIEQRIILKSLLGTIGTMYSQLDVLEGLQLNT